MDNWPVNITKHWIENFIIKLNICPFAKDPYESGELEIIDCPEETLEDQIQFFESASKTLLNSKKLTNSLLIYSGIKDNFISFLDFFDTLNQIIENCNLLDQIQLVCFHPKFQFQGTKTDERINYVNRSPFPMVHLVKMDEMDRVISDPMMGERINLQNEKTLKSLNSKDFDQLLTCYFS